MYGLSKLESYYPVKIELEVKAFALLRKGGKKEEKG